MAVLRPGSDATLEACSTPLAGPETFHVATRNPINRAPTFELEARRLDWTLPSCPLR